MPVPRHWSQKRKYLQGKRGIEKPPFKLPEFIEATGACLLRIQVSWFNAYYAWSEVAQCMAPR